MLRHVNDTLSFGLPGSRRVTPSRSLPTVVKTPSSRPGRFHSGVAYVRSETVRDVLLARIPRRLCLIDCRFPYEYDAGHINVAVNYPAPDSLSVHTYLQSQCQLTDEFITCIFHCEFSQYRAPRMSAAVARLLKGSVLNSRIEIYIMKGGYADFFSKFADMCVPRGYLPMHDGPSDLNRCFLSKSNSSSRSQLLPLPVDFYEVSKRGNSEALTVAPQNFQRLTFTQSQYNSRPQRLSTGNLHAALGTQGAQSYASRFSGEMDSVEASRKSQRPRLSSPMVACSLFQSNTPRSLVCDVVSPANGF